MFYLYTKTENPISKENLFQKKIDMSITSFERKSPIDEKSGIVVMASAVDEKTLLEKWKIILRNLER